MPESSVAEALAAQASLIADGRSLLSEGRADEARMVAEEALANDPASTPALSLLGDAHEAEGRVDAALIAYERILELQPDSALDKIKVAHLRKRLNARLLEDESARRSESRRRALISGLAATVAVGAFGAWWGYRSSLPMATGPQPVDAGRFVQSEPFRVAANQPPSRPAVSPESDPSREEVPPSLEPRREQASPPAVQSSARAARPLGTLPAAVGSDLAGPIDAGNRPINPLPAGIQIQPNPGAAAPPDSVTRNDPDPDPEPEKARPKPEEEKGIVEVRVSSGQPERRGGAETRSSEATGENLMRVAREQYQLGSYSKAATTLQQAIQAGADPGVANQRLGQALERLGRRDEAAAAYSRAARAYEASLQRNPNNARLRDALEATRQALRVVQGGG